MTCQSHTTFMSIDPLTASEDSIMAGTKCQKYTIYRPKTP